MMPLCSLSDCWAHGITQERHWAKFLFLWACPLQFPEPVPKGFHEECFTSITSAQFSFFFFCHLRFGLFSLFSGFYFPLYSTYISEELLPGSLHRLLSGEDNLIPPPMTGFNQLSLVIIRKPPTPIPFSKGSWEFHRIETERHWSPKGPPTTIPTRKGCEHSEHGWGGVHYRKCGTCTGQGGAVLTLREENSQSESDLTRKRTFPSLWSVLSTTFTANGHLFLKYRIQ